MVVRPALTVHLVALVALVALGRTRAARVELGMTLQILWAAAAVVGRVTARPDRRGRMVAAVATAALEDHLEGVAAVMAVAPDQPPTVQLMVAAVAGSVRLPPV